MARKKKTPTVVTPMARCPVAKCNQFLPWQPHPTQPGRERAVCNCRHAIYHNQSVAERPTPAAAVNVEEESTDDSTE
jgi:hypothetical protein